MEEKIKEEELSESHIERIKKEFKTHRNAIDFDEKFINHCFTKVKKGIRSNQRRARQGAIMNDPKTHYKNGNSPNFNHSLF